MSTTTSQSLRSPGLIVGAQVVGLSVWGFGEEGCFGLGLRALGLRLKLVHILPFAFQNYQCVVKSENS